MGRETIEIEKMCTKGGQGNTRNSEYVHKKMGREPIGIGKNVHEKVVRGEEVGRETIRIGKNEPEKKGREQSKWERIARKCARKGVQKCARNCTRKCARKYEQAVWKIE